MAIDLQKGMMMDLYKQAQSKLPETISLPLQLPTMYENFVTKNASSVSQIESALRSLTYIIPGALLSRPCKQCMLTVYLGRFRESEIASESCAPPARRCQRPIILTYYHSTFRRSITLPLP